MIIPFIFKVILYIDVLLSPGVSVKNQPTMQEILVRSLCGEDALEQGMATHSRVHAWRIPGTEEPGGLQFMGLQSFRHN